MPRSDWITLAVVAIAAVLLILERDRPDLTAFLAALSLHLTGVVEHSVGTNPPLIKAITIQGLFIDLPPYMALNTVVSRKVCKLDSFIGTESRF